MEVSPPSTALSATSPYWDPGKLFVGGISWDTGEPELKDYFNKYGAVTEVAAAKDRTTGNPRGFAFVKFSDPDSAERALSDKDPHVISGRTVDVRKARARTGHQGNNQPSHHRYRRQKQNEYGASSNGDTNNNGHSRSHIRSKKIFVGGLASNINEVEFRNYFEKFGVVTDVAVIFDNVTHRPRGFGFVEFDSEEAVDKVMQKSFHELNSRLVEVKIAVPKDGGRHKNAGNYNGGSVNSRMGGGAELPAGNYQSGMYSMYSARHEYFYAYPPPSAYGYTYGTYGYGGGYPFGVHDGGSYGAPFPNQENHWSDQGFVAVRGNQVPYGSTAMYPSYINAGFSGVYLSMPGGFQGVASDADRLNQTNDNVQTTSGADTISSQVANLNLDAH